MTHPTRQNLPFQKVLHKVTTKDAQPSSSSVASLLVSVTGLLVVRPYSPRSDHVLLTPRATGRRQPQPAAIQPDIPFDARGRELLCVSLLSFLVNHLFLTTTASFNDIFRLNYA